MSKARRLRIVQVISNFPNAWPLPPFNQGGTEKVVSDLTNALVRKGHHVYVFAARKSRSLARVIHYPKGMRDRGIRKFVLKRIPKNVDVIHDHTFTSTIGKANPRIPTVCTMHLPVKHRVKNPVYVSRRARKVMGSNSGYYVYNGILPSEYEFSSKKNGYLLFIGRILREKGVLHAISIAERTNKRLIIAGPIKDRALYRNKIVPRIRKNPNIRYVGAVGGKKKQNLLKHAECLLFPTIWEEPFGLVMIEAMISGTPVIALRNGAVPEVLKGFPELICNSVNGMVKQVKRNRYPSPSALRSYVRGRFTVNHMTDNYLRIYRKVIKSGSKIR